MCVCRALPPSYKYLTIYFIHPLPDQDVYHEWVSDQTARIYHLDFTGCEKSRDKIGYHHKVVTVETQLWQIRAGINNCFKTVYPLHPWMRFSEGLDRRGRGLYLWGVYWSWHTDTLCKLTENFCLKALIRTDNFFLKGNGERHLPKTNTEIWALPHGDLTKRSSYWQYYLRKCMREGLNREYILNN